MQNLIPNKRADADISPRKVIFYIIFGILASIAFLIIVWIVSSTNSEISVIPENRENYLLTQRFLSSPYCFAFQDQETGRIQVSTIDLEKFTQANLNNCYNVGSAKAKAYRLTLKHENGEIKITTSNWEGFLSRAETIDVNVKGQSKMASLFIEVQDV